MEGPYRDLGSGFARLTGIEGARRSPSHVNTVEDALYELLRNSRDAGARNIYVASSLHGRRYRTLTVIDDGHGIPVPYKDLVFEPGVTTRHLYHGRGSATAGAPRPRSGLSLYQVKNSATSAAVLSTSHPTAIKATFDTRLTPERSLQSGTRSSRSNLRATILNFLSEETEETSARHTKIYYASPARILATLLKYRIIHLRNEARVVEGLAEAGQRVGLSVSSRTLQRVLRGEVSTVDSVSGYEAGVQEVRERAGEGEELERERGRARLDLGDEEVAKIAAILGEAARTRYLEVGTLEFESRPGEIVVRSRIYEPEEEYE